MHVKDCNFTQMKSKYGGAIFSSLSIGEIVIETSIIANNSAIYDGGALHFETASKFRGSAAYSA